jgi:hypothetical protein
LTGEKNLPKHAFFMYFMVVIRRREREGIIEKFVQKAQMRNSVAVLLSHSLISGFFRNVFR